MRRTINQRLHASTLAAWLLIAAGCGEESTHSKAHQSDNANTVAVQLGQGRHSFVALHDGDTMLLEMGTQGYRHVYAAVRAQVPEGFYSVALQLHDSAGQNVASPFTASVPFVAHDGPWSEALGLLVVIPNPISVLQQSSTLNLSTLQITVHPDPPQRPGVAARQIKIAWN